MSCIVTIGLITLNLPKGAIVAQSRTDKIRVLPFQKKNGKMSKEQIINASFKEMLRKGIISVVADAPEKVEVKEEVTA
jgi:hypothetical protein